MILCYCRDDISEGFALLRHAANTRAHLPSVHDLVLRDSRTLKSDYYLSVAASMGHPPAWQEKLTAAEMCARFRRPGRRRFGAAPGPPVPEQAAGEALPGLEGGKGGADVPLLEPAVREVGAQGAAGVLR